MIGFSLLAVSFSLLPPAYLDLLELLNAVQIGAKRFHLVFDGIHGDRFGYSSSAKQGRDDRQNSGGGDEQSTE